jgi:hypothetical protein
VIRPAQAISDSLISGETPGIAAVAVGHDPRPRPLHDPVAGTDDEAGRGFRLSVAARGRFSPPRRPPRAAKPFALRKDSSAGTTYFDADFSAWPAPPAWHRHR